MSRVCRSMAPLLEAYLDGELAPSQSLEVESHAAGCATCAERVALDRAVRAGLRARARAVAPDASLRARVEASMLAEHARATSSGAETERLPGRFALALAAAAALPIAWGVTHPSADFGAEREPVSASAQASAAVGLETLLDELVRWHAKPLPPETANPNDLVGFDSYVGVPVREPKLVRMLGAKLVGARMLTVHPAQTAAMLQYTMQGDHRVSVYVYDPHHVAAAPTTLRPRIVGNQPIYVARIAGYSVAAAEKRGVGYAVTSDLGDDASAEIAVATTGRDGAD